MAPTFPEPRDAMKNRTRFLSILDSYRGVAAAVAAIATWMLFTLLVARPEILVLLAGLTGYAAALVLLLIGDRLLQRRVEEAAVEREQMLASAHRDALTGTFTRSWFLAALRSEVGLESTTPVGYMQIDMDHLKVLNDTGGHAAGDLALQHLIRAVGAVLPGALLGRLGGDEFGILVRGIDSKAALRRLGDQVLKRLGEPIQISGRPVRLSATIGVAIAPQDAQDADQLISKADIALYQGKRNGRCVTVCFDEGMLVDERHRRFIERELRAAILLNELDLFYQPIHAVNGSGLRCYEALVRWQHSVRGMIMPSDFIPVAEESDLIDKLGDWVLRRACLDFAALGAPAVSINVSVVQLRRPDFSERFLAILKETGTPGERLVVEVTETVPMQAGTVEQGNLLTLHEAGVRIAIDDFGAGHASLEYLRGFAFDIIKIDRSYVANLPQSRPDALIVSAICRIAVQLGLEVVAEGIETEEQKQFLVECGCTGLQGYLLGRPAPLRIDRASGRALAAA